MNKKSEILKEKKAPASFIKLAMRNMVKKGKKSIIHFSITFLILVGILLMLATLGKPNLPV
tara:strand:- start:10020 stop:10202 length:183 start_codon:yes stop_codon:yes gene_type:complete